MYLVDQLRSLRSRLFHKNLINGSAWQIQRFNTVQTVLTMWAVQLVWSYKYSFLQWWISWSHPSRTAYLSTPAYESKNKLDQKVVTGLSLPNVDELIHTESLAMITKTVYHLPFEFAKSHLSLHKSLGIVNNEDLSHLAIWDNLSKFLIETSS